MPERTAKVPHEYASRQLSPGDQFDVEPEHVKLLLLLGRIEPVEGEPGYIAKAMTQDAPTPYLTRDMAAPNERTKRAYHRKAAAQ